MALNKPDAIEKARRELAKRLGVKDIEVRDAGVQDADFPDMALGASVSGEMSGQMITPGWRIHLEANGKTYEFRANEHQLRLFNFDGKNYKI